MDMTSKVPSDSLSKTAIKLVPLTVVTPVIPAQNSRSVSPDSREEPRSQNKHSALLPRHATWLRNASVGVFGVVPERAKNAA